MAVKLIAFDLDGTLLDNKKNIPPENLKALEAAAQTGIVLVPATGRILPGLPEAVRKLPSVRYCIGSNGAFVYDLVEDKYISEALMPIELCQRLMDKMDTLNVIYDCYRDNWGYMSRHMYENMENYIRSQGVLDMTRRTRIPVDDLRQDIVSLGRPVQKMQMHFKDMRDRAYQLENMPGEFPDAVFSSSISTNIEINSPDATKGQALRSLCLLLGIDINDCLAFGDGSNDIDMLKIAGIGVAMENAEETVKAVSDWMAPSNEDCGLAAGVYKFCNL